MHSCGIETALDFCGRPRAWAESRFGANGLRTWTELHGTPALQEERRERRESICTSRSFASMTSDPEELARIVSDFAGACAHELRKEGSAAFRVEVFLYTNRFREDLPQFFPRGETVLEQATDSTQGIVSAALKVFREIFRPGYMYKKAGVTLGVSGDANDYFGKGLSGGVLSVRPPERATYKFDENVIVGNVAFERLRPAAEGEGSFVAHGQVQRQRGRPAAPRNPGGGGIHRMHEDGAPLPQVHHGLERTYGDTSS